MPTGGLYNQAPFTVEPHVPIPANAAPSAIDELDPSDTLVQASQDYAPESNITATFAAPGPLYAEVTLAPVTPFVEPYAITWEWGDGQQETSDSPGDLIQGHQYAAPGDYIVQVTIEQPGLPSLRAYGTVPVT